mgnify:CR=1 FL=1
MTADKTMLLNEENLLELFLVREARCREQGKPRQVGWKMLRYQLKVPKQYQTLITEINELEKSFSELTDIEIRTQSFKFQNEYQETQNLSALISRSFALTREASKRTINLRHYDIQLIGGLVLNDGKTDGNSSVIFLSYLSFNDS